MLLKKNVFFTGKRIDGIWHTSIVVYEREYFFGSGGVESCTPVSIKKEVEVIIVNDEF